MKGLINMTVPPFRHHYSVFFTEDLRSNNYPFLIKIRNPILSISSMVCGSTRSIQRITFEGIIDEDVVNTKGTFVIVPDNKTSGRIFYTTMGNTTDIPLELFNSVSVGRLLGYELELSTLGDQKSYVAADMSSLFDLDISEMLNMVSVCVGILNHEKFEDENERSFYIALIKACKNRYLEMNEEINKLYEPMSSIVNDSQNIQSMLDTNAFTDFLSRIKDNISALLMGVPMIERVIYNAPNTIVFWNDGTSTTVTTTDGEEFNKEIGLAMAIAKKYFSVRDSHPRAAFRKVVKNADDYTEASNRRRNQREAKKQKHLEDNNGHHADI